MAGLPTLAHHEVNLSFHGNEWTGWRLITNPAPEQSGTKNGAGMGEHRSAAQSTNAGFHNVQRVRTCLQRVEGWTDGQTDGRPDGRIDHAET